MSTLPLGRGMELMDWIGVAGVGVNLLMLALAQRGRVDTDAKGKEKDQFRCAPHEHARALSHTSRSTIAASSAKLTRVPV
jgi:hypothetical protein